MARWKLMRPHYLNVPGEEWEYSETDRKTGRARKVKFNVPRLLDPADPTCWTKSWGLRDDADGEIIVCHEGLGDPSDQIFSGDPTPDMLPVDDEAKAISLSFAGRWHMKPESMYGDYSQSLVDSFQLELAEAQAKPIEIPGLTNLVGAIAKQTEILGKLVEGRRI